MSYHGVTCKIYREKLDAQILKEYIGVLEGDGEDQILYTKNLPITTDAGVATDDETKVAVYTDGKSVGSWSTYATDGSDYKITGATGIVTIQAAENQAANATERISIDYYYRAEVGMGQTAKIEDSRVQMPVWKLGSALVQEIKSGKRPAVKLDYDSFYITRDELGGVLSEADFTKVMTEYDFYMYPNGTTAGQPRIKVADIKATFNSMEVGIDTILISKGRYVGKAYEYDVVPA